MWIITSVAARVLQGVMYLDITGQDVGLRRVISLHPPHHRLPKCAYPQEAQPFYPSLGAPELIDGLDLGFKGVQHGAPAEINIVLFT